MLCAPVPSRHRRGPTPALQRRVLRMRQARSALAMLKLLIEREKMPPPRCAEIACATWPSRHHSLAFSEYLFLRIVRLRSGGLRRVHGEG
jgi:hypothetical protein